MEKDNNNSKYNNNSNNSINNPFQTTEYLEKTSFSSKENNKSIISEQNPTPKHNTSQRHKTPTNKYSINPYDIPRPSQEKEIYLNKENLPIYETNLSTSLPFSTKFYTVKETKNSSCKFIRPTINAIPTSPSFFDETGLPFGICVRPFYQINKNESQIPKIQNNGHIFRCEKCKSYINNKYKFTYSKLNKQIAICNLCHHENDLNINFQGIKNEYLNNNDTSCLELINPTIDFIAPQNFKSKKIFVPHYLFMIDISETSYQLGLPSYIINSIQINLDSIHNYENSYIAFALYDFKNIYYFYIEKDDVRISIMGDINDPFCPLSLKKLYIKIGSNQEKINSLIEKINLFINDKNKNFNNNINIKNKQISTITGCAIKSGVDSLLENGGRILVFTCNPCNHGFGASIIREIYLKNNKVKDPHKSNPFFPQHNLFAEIGQKAAKNKIVIDQFIFLSELYDISTFSIASTLSGGDIFFYQDVGGEVPQYLYEKLYFDITRVLTRPNYYNCKFMLRYSKGIDCYEILGPFTKKLGDAFELGGCDPDYCFYYNFRLNQQFKKDEILHIQLAALYEDNYSDIYIRVFNYSFEVIEELPNLFGLLDMNSIMKSLVYKSISLIYNTNFQDIKKFLEDKIINTFKYYRINVKKKASASQLIIPLGIQYIPLYINSFFKLNIFLDNAKSNKINQILYIANKLLREPINRTIKFLYPKFYRIDNIKKGQYDINNEENRIYNIGLLNEKYNIINKPLLLRLSKDEIDFDSAYLIDDGIFINIFIFNQINSNFYQDLFNIGNFYDLKNIGINELNQENQTELNQRILNIISQLRNENDDYIQPIRIFFFEENDISNFILNQLLKEDELNGYSNYTEYLCTIHKKIQENFIYF
jgi:hypothetical protein